MSFVTENSRDMLYYVSFQNGYIGKALCRVGRTASPVSDSTPDTAWMTDASEDEIREAALNAGAIYLEIWRLGEKP